MLVLRPERDPELVEGERFRASRPTRFVPTHVGTSCDIRAERPQVSRANREGVEVPSF